MASTSASYVHKIRRAGLDVQTVPETHGGPFKGGIGSITLEARRVMNTAEGLRKDFVVTAHLRMSIPVLLQLRDVIDAIEVMARDEKAAELSALASGHATH
jgi:hypothetical protein